MRNALIGIGIATLLLAAPLAAADHDLTKQATYEFGPPGDLITITCLTGDEDLGTDCDATDLTQDDSIDIGGFIIGAEDLQGFTTGQGSIVDDVFGANVVGGWLCTDNDGDGGACDESSGEMRVIACGVWPPSSLPSAFDAVAGFVNGPVFQTLDCDPVQAPTSTSGGLLDPSGGIFVSFTH